MDSGGLRGLWAIIAGGRRFGRRFLAKEVGLDRQETVPPSAGGDVNSGGDASRAVFAVGRALGDLSRGGIVVLDDGERGASALLAAECATPERLARLEALPGAGVRLALSARRARTLGVTVAAAGRAVALPLAPPLDAEAVRGLADPSARSGGLVSLPYVAGAQVAHAHDMAATALAKLAGLLPAVLARSLDAAACGPFAAWARDNDMMRVSPADIARFRDGAGAALTRVGAARVPLAGAEDARIVAFRPADGGGEHIAIVIGEPDFAQPVLTRLHSQCFTGDLLGSLRCDCGDQLRNAVRRIAADGAGILLYLAQEGRGIGLVNKLRAYEIQDRGYDTFDANEMLGFDADEREYRTAAGMLRDLGCERVRLMTDNPDKVAALRRYGIDVAERIPHTVAANRHNERYLRAKASRRARSPGG